MTIPEADPSPVLPIWRGRKGTIATVILGVLALICGIGLSAFAERFAVVPTCRNYAQEHGWQYVSMHTYSDPLTNRSGAICTFKSSQGYTEDVYLRDISLFTSFWVSFAVTLFITVPGFLILFAVVRTCLWKRRSAAQRRL